MKRFSKELGSCIIGITAAGILLNPVSVFADQTDELTDDIPLYTLEELVVTAKRVDPRSIYQENANITVISQKKIEQMHYQNVEEALRTVPGIDFLNYGLQGYNLNSIRINGSDDVILLVDGVRASATGMGNLAELSMATNMSNIERIEILRGANAVRFGSDAKGGVINIVTKKGRGVRTNLTVAGGFYEREQYKLAHEGGKKNIHYRVYGEKYRQGDTRDGHGVITPGSTDYKNVGLKVDAQVGDKAAVGVNWNEQKNNFSFYDWIYGQDCVGRFDSREWNVSLVYDFDDKNYSTVSYRYNNYDHHAQQYWLYNALWEFFTHKYDTRALRTQMVHTFDDHHVVAVGYEDTRTKTGTSTKFPVKAAFLTHEWTFDDKWDLNWGMRYDKVDTDYNEIDSRVSKSINIGHRFDKKNKMYASYNDYMVMPSIWELNVRFEEKEHLNLETGKNYEVGYTHDFDPTSVITAHYFHRQSEDAAGFNSFQKKFTNFDEKSSGWDVKYSKRFGDSLTLGLGVSRISMDVTNDASYGGLPGIMRGYLPKWTTNVTLEYEKDKWEVGLDGRRFLDRAGKQFDEKGWPTSNYWVWNLGLNYKPDSRTKVFMKVNNLFDQYYAEQTQVIWGIHPNRDPKQWYAMPGRNIMVGMEYQF